MLKISRKTKKGQSILEYSVLFIIMIGALMTTQTYLKRSIQGRWKTTGDDMGTQYDPRAAESETTHTLYSEQNTKVTIMKDPAHPSNKERWFTSRIDTSDTQETRKGTESVDSY